MTDLFSFAGVPLDDQIYRGKLWGHPVYRVWSGMVTRCENPNDAGYKNYGGRGISICPEWRNSSRLFISWALANGWRKGLQIDRIDNDGPYSPDNCRFVSRRENCLNKRNTRRLKDGRPAQPVAEELGLNLATFNARVFRGLSCDDALNYKHGLRLSDGRKGVDVAAENGVSYNLFWVRVIRGWPADLAATLPVGSRKPAKKT